MKSSFLKYLFFPVLFLLVFQGEGRGEVFSGFGKEEQVLTAAKNHVNNLPLEGLGLVKLTDAKAIAVQTSALPPNKMVELIKSYTIGDPSEIDFVGNMNSIQGFYVKAAIDARSVGKMDDVATFYAALEQVRKYRQLEPLKDHIDDVSDLWQDVEKLDLFISDLASNKNLLDFFKAADDATRLKYAGAWDALKKTGLRTDDGVWLPAVSKWIEEGVTYVDNVLPVKYFHNGNEIARIVDDKFIPTKFHFDGAFINDVKLSGQSFGKDVIRASDGTIGFRYQFQKSKIYRAMSDAEWQSVQANNGLSIGNGTENFVSTSRAYSESYIGQPGYDVLVEFTVQPKTVQELAKIGVKDQSNLIMNSGFDDLAPVSSGWSLNKAFFKGEGTAVNIGLGTQSVNTFNENITTFIRLN